MKIKKSNILVKLGDFRVVKSLEKDKEEKRKRWLNTGETLCALLNVNINKPSEVKRYCNTYSFFVSVSVKGTTEIICRLQKELKLLVEKITTNTLTKNEIDTINSHLVNKKNLIKIVDNKFYSDWNKKVNPISTETENVLTIPNNFIIETYSADPITSLYIDLVKMIIKNQKIKECRDCGKMFFVTRKDKSFCEKACEHRYGVRKGRNLKT